MWNLSFYDAAASAIHHCMLVEIIVASLLLSPLPRELSESFLIRKRLMRAGSDMFQILAYEVGLVIDFLLSACRRKCVRYPYYLGYESHSTLVGVRHGCAYESK